MVVKTQAKLVEKYKLSDEVYHLIFKTNDEFNFKVGQFVNFVIPVQGEERPLRRSYSITSISKEEENFIFELCIKIEPEGKFTPQLQLADIGTQYDIMGPLGLFGLKHIEEGYDQVFIAAGTGIAPMRAFIKELLENIHYTSKVVLIFGVRSEEDILYLEEFQKFSKDFSQFSYYVTLSRPTSNWEGRNGYVQEHLKDIIVKVKLNIHSTHFYMCGRTKMVDSVHEMLDSINVVKENRSHEKFG